MSNWRSLRKAGRECGLSDPVVKRLVNQGRISVRRLPGGRPEVDVAELRRIIEASTRRAAVAVAG